MPTGGFTQNLIKTIFLASLSFSLFALSFSLALAQDAIQCTPADVSLNRNLKFVNPASNNIYLGTGKLNFSSGNDNLYATRDGSNMLFYSASASILTKSDTLLLQNASGDRIAGIYNSNPGIPLQAANDTHYLIVDGKIEGWEVKGLDQLCVRGSCRTSWPVDTDTQDLSFDSVTGILKLT